MALRAIPFTQREKEVYMSEHLVIETRICKGGILLQNLPLKEDTPVKVVIIPRTNLRRLSFRQTRALLQEIPGNLSEDVAEERAGR